MRRFPTWVPAIALLLLAPLLLSLPLAAQQTGQGRTGRRRTFSITGVVRDGATNSTVDGAKVELRSVAGGVIATMFTGMTGNFQFDGISSGGYNLVVDQAGYAPVTQDVQVLDSPLMGIQIDLLRAGGDKAGAPASRGPKVSAHELAAPRKAQEAMEKGMALLYDKSDYRGSVAEFERAVQAYPSYYEAYAQMGVAYVNLKDNAAAENAFRKSYDLSGGKYISACFLLAKFLSFSLRFAEAEPIARQGVEVDPDSWQANEELARALVGLNRFQDAESYAVEADKLKPDQSAIQLLLADIHSHVRNFPALLDNLNAYLRLAPTGAQAEKISSMRDQLQQALANQAAGAAPAAASSPAAPAAASPADSPAPSLRTPNP
jgi:Carboxypeptidase regulatory-like domain/Tetratricopeptide repeat